MRLAVANTVAGHFFDVEKLSVEELLEVMRFSAGSVKVTFQIRASSAAAAEKIRKKATGGDAGKRIRDGVLAKVGEIPGIEATREDINAPIGMTEIQATPARALRSLTSAAKSWSSQGSPELDLSGQRGEEKE